MTYLVYELEPGDTLTVIKPTDGEVYYEQAIVVPTCIQIAREGRATGLRPGTRLLLGLALPA